MKLKLNIKSLMVPWWVKREDGWESRAAPATVREDEALVSHCPALNWAR